MSYYRVNYPAAAFYWPSEFVEEAAPFHRRSFITRHPYHLYRSLNHSPPMTPMHLFAPSAHRRTLGTLPFAMRRYSFPTGILVKKRISPQEQLKDQQFLKRRANEELLLRKRLAKLRKIQEQHLQTFKTTTTGAAVYAAQSEAEEEIVKKLLADDRIQFYATFDSEHGWTVLKDSQSSPDQLMTNQLMTNEQQEASEGSPVHDKAAPSSPVPTAVSEEEVSVEDVDEEDADENSDIVELEVPAVTHKHLEKFQRDDLPHQDAAVDLEKLYHRELELLSMLGYTDTAQLLPLLKEHVGLPKGQSRDAVRAGLRKVVAALTTNQQSLHQEDAARPEAA